VGGAGAAGARLIVVDIATAYATTRESLLELGDTLTGDQLDTPVPALPGWTVKDTYGHLVGECADVLDGRLDGMISDQWTAAQVARHATTPFTEVLAEWRERGPELDRWIEEARPTRAMFLALDAYTHEQDLLAAVGERGRRDDPRVRFLAGLSRDAFDRRFRNDGIPALRLVQPAGEFVLGDGEPSVTLHVDDYELMRMLFGRRSLAQMRAARWDGDPTALLDHLHLFPCPEVDLSD